MTDQSLSQMRAERDRLNAQIAETEAQETATHNSRIADVEGALEEFAQPRCWPVVKRRRKNAELLDIGLPGSVVTVALYYDEEGYPVGSTAVSVTDNASKVTALFDGVPAPSVVTQLVQAWLAASGDQLTVEA